jgi:hypothetical protein
LFNPVDTRTEPFQSRIMTGFGRARLLPSLFISPRLRTGSADHPSGGAPSPSRENETALGTDSRGGASSSGGQTGRAHNLANNWPETGKLAFFWRIRRLVQSTSLRWRQSRLSQARQFIVRQNGRHIERTYEVLTRG